MTKQISTGDFKWIILDNLLYGYRENLNYINCQKSINTNIKKILLFDLDNTLIKTKSGKVFPISKDDWTWIDNSVKEYFSANLPNNVVTGIITNQKGLKSEFMINNWIEKMNNIMKEIRIDFVFVSLKDDMYRKPMTKSWDYIKEQLLSNIDINRLKRKNKIYYIGDALGRKDDFSDTDIKYAFNCGFKIKSPEKLFNYGVVNNNVTITYPLIEYYSKEEQNNILLSIDDLISNYIHDDPFIKNKIIVVMVGFPASGKSFLRKYILNKFNEFKYINNDDIKNKVSDTNLIKSDYKKYNYLVDDNTNMSILNRKKINNNFSDYKKIVIWFNYLPDVAKHLNYMRMFWFGGQLISQVVYRTLNANSEPPKITEGFDNIIEINKIFNDFNYDDKIKYYF